MDKYEYKVRADEIKELISRCEYAQAAEIADTIDWRRVKSVMMLCTISDLYKINRRYEDARDMLLLAYERRPGGRTICYSLCELSIKMEEFVEAVEYYKEFVQAAPKDPGRFILQYKLYEAQDVSLEERIAVLEELKKRDYREKWAYELAYLYHRIGLAARCVEECDELILWFGDGKYVIKAMELKMLHQPLSPSQQEKYDHRFDAPMGYQQLQAVSGNYVEPGVAEQQGENVAAIDVGVESSNMDSDVVGMEGNMAAQGYNANWEQSSGEGGAEPSDMNNSMENQMQSGYNAEGAVEPDYANVVHNGTNTMENTVEQPVASEEDELDIQVKTMDMGQYNTINLQAELAAGLREVLAEEQAKNPIQDPITRAIVAPMFEMDTETLDYPEIDEVSEDDLEPIAEEIEATEVFFGETGEIGDVPPIPKTVPDITAEIVMEQLRQENVATEVAQEPAEAVTSMEVEAAEESVGVVTAQISENTTKFVNTEPPRELAHVLSQESDGQLSLVMPESEQIEKQITGQMNIEDILAEWERIKKENQEKREEEVRQHVLQQTGNMFTEFEAAVRDGLLEQLEREKDAKAAEENVIPVEEAVAEGEYFEEAPEENAFFEEAVIEQDGELGEVEELEEIVEEVEQIFDDETYEVESVGESEEAYEAEEVQFEVEEPAYEEAPDVREFDIEEMVQIEEVETTSEEEQQSESLAFNEDVQEVEPEVSYEAGQIFEVEQTLENELPSENEQPLENEQALEDEQFLESEQALEDEQSLENEQALEDEQPLENEQPLEPPVPMDEATMAEELKAMVAQLPVTEITEKRPVDPEYEETMEELRAAASGFEEAMVKLQSSKETQQEDEPMQQQESQQASQPIAQQMEQLSGTAVQQELQQNTKPAEHQEESKQAPRVERDKVKVRALTREEKELYAPFIQSRSAREQLVRAIDNITLAAYTGNVIITGDEGMDTLTLAKNMIRELQATDSNFSGKVAKISGHALNSKDVATTIGQLKNGALIVSKASELNSDVANAMYKALQQEHQGIVVVLVDAKKPMDKFLAKNEQLKDLFTARMDVEALSNDTLVAFGRRYARELEYSIDELGMLALHTRIAERQTIDHVVTVIEVKEIVDKAIRRANKKTLGHFFDILFAKRYDEEDMIVLSEKDFA